MIMKKIFYVAAALMMLVATGCKEEQRSQDLTAESTQIDSLEKIIDQKDNEINDMMSTLNQIQQGFREITEAENRVTIAKDGERADKAQQIRENMKFIANKMKANRDLINKLRQQARESSVKGEQLKTTIEGLVKQLEGKDQELQKLMTDTYNDHRLFRFQY